MNDDDDIPHLDWRLNNEWYSWKGYMVYTELGLIVRGYCCCSGCRHCPYEPKHSGYNKIREEISDPLEKQQKG